MKKRLSKLTALFLSLAMALSLALPAWAVEDTAAPPLISPAPAETASYLSWGEFLQQYVEDHPEFYDSFDADARFEASYGNWITKEEFMKEWELTDEAAFKEYLWQEYLYEYVYVDDGSTLFQAADAAYNDYLIQFYEARHPGELNKLKTEDLLAVWGYTKTLTPIEQFMKDQELSDKAEVRPILLRNYVLDRLRAEDNHTNALAYQELYPEQWASFDADSWFAEKYTFENDKEGYMSYYSLSTEEEFREAMFVDYVDSESWKWNLDWWDGNGPKAVTLAVNGETVEAEIALEGGTTYTDAATLNAILGTGLTGDHIPIRKTAEAAGWDVVWNSRCKQVALYRRDSLPQGDFTQFDTLMNRLLSSAKTEKGQGYKTTQTTTLKLTAFNSLDGDKTATARITTELLQRDTLYEYTLTVNAGDLISLMPKLFLEQINTQLESQNLSSLLRACKITMILNAETGDIYFNAPALSLLDSNFTADTWLHLDAGQSLSLLADLGSLEWNTNDFLYQTLLNDSANNYWGAQMPYFNYLQSQEMLDSLLGPQYFTERGGTLTWSLNAQSLQDLLAQEDAETAAQIASLFKELSVKFSASPNGAITSEAVLRLDMDALAQWSQDAYDAPDPFYTALTAWVLNLLDFRLESRASGTASSSTSTASLHWKNQFKLEMSSTSNRQKIAASPRSAPPKGAEIIDFS